MAAAVVAGSAFMIYKSVTGGGAKSGDGDAAAAKSDAESVNPETEPEVLENSFFLKVGDAPRDNEQKIIKWVEDQVEALLSENEGRKLIVVDKVLSRTDYLRFMLILKCR